MRKKVSSELKFSSELSVYYNLVNEYKQKYTSIVIYGNGSSGKIIAHLLGESLNCIVDLSSGTSDFTNSKTIYNPKVLNKIVFDVVLISTLGREKEIIKYLCEDIGIARQKIVLLDLFDENDENEIENSTNLVSSVNNDIKKKLAYVSPLPPVQSGIATYSSELLNVLTKYYDIDVIVEQEVYEKKDDYRVVNFKDLMQNFTLYDRVIYHFGNSTYHRYMVELLYYVPGIVVLHDFYLSGCLNFKSTTNSLKRNFLYSHGNIDNDKNDEYIVKNYPCSRKIIDLAKGVIVHSEYAKELAREWYGKTYGNSFKTIPHLRTIAQKLDNNLTVKQELHYQENDFIVCSFGTINDHKCNKELLEAWCKSSLSDQSNIYLIFVGSAMNSKYGQELQEMILNSKHKNNIKITGWVSESVYKKYLSIADIAVQLRLNSSGETSGTVLDCMNYAIATITNKYGTMADIDDQAVIMMNENFSTEVLVKELENLYYNQEYKIDLGIKANEYIMKNHNPVYCASTYYDAIENFYNTDRIFE